MIPGGPGAALLAFALAGAAPPRPVLVSAAASLRGVLSEAAPGVPLTLNLGASGLLLRQVEQGAPVDLLVSASPDELDALERDGRLVPGTRRTLAANALVVAARRGVEPPAALAGLADPRFARIAVGNPRTAPVGRYARDALRSAGIESAVAPRLVFGEDARQVLAYVARGEVDAGIVYVTDLALEPGRVVRGPEAPAGSHGPILCQAALVRDGPSAPAARRVLDWLASAEGRALFARHGFRPPP